MALPELIKDFWENGVHFGHLSKHWNPKMKRFIFGKKKNIYIIDLEKTAAQLEEAGVFLRELAKNGGKVLFVGTKRHIREQIRELAESCEMSYVVERWVGGLLTNFVTIERRVKKYIDLKAKKEAGEFEHLPSKEVAKLNKELDRMEKIYSGVTGLTSLPQCVMVIDPRREHACVHEANILSIPVVALIDTDADPDKVDYPIPGNDDAMKSVKVIVTNLVKSIKDGIEDAKNLQSETAPAQEAPLAASEDAGSGTMTDDSPADTAEKIDESEGIDGSADDAKDKKEDQ